MMALLLMWLTQVTHEAEWAVLVSGTYLLLSDLFVTWLIVRWVVGRVWRDA